MLFITHLTLWLLTSSSEQMPELPVSFEYGLKIWSLMEGIKEKLEKEWNCNSEYLTKCHFPEFEGVNY